MPLEPRPAQPIVFELTPQGYQASLPLLGISGSGESEEEATLALTAQARILIADYLASPAFFFELEGGSAALPYIFAMQDADAAGELHEFLTGEALPDSADGVS